MGKFMDNFAVQSRDNLLPLTRVGLYLTAGFFAGRKVIQGTSAGFFALSAKVADHLAIDRGKIDPGSWRQWFHVNRDRFFVMTQKNIHRDLAIAGILATGGLVTEQLENRLNQSIKNREADETIPAKIWTGRHTEASGDFKEWLFHSTPPQKSYSWMDACRRFRITEMTFTGSARCGPKCQAAVAHYQESWAIITAPIRTLWNKAAGFSSHWSHQGWNLGKTGLHKGLSLGESGIYETGKGLSYSWSWTQENVYGTKTFSHKCQSAASSIGDWTVWGVSGAKNKGLQGLGLGAKAAVSGWDFGKSGISTSWNWSKNASFTVLDKTIDWTFLSAGWLQAATDKLANKMRK